MTMWDECVSPRRSLQLTSQIPALCRYDEGTEFMPVVSHSSQLRVHPSYRFVALDVDGYDLSSDWCMRIVGFAAEAFHGQCTLQSKNCWIIGARGRTTTVDARMRRTSMGSRVRLGNRGSQGAARVRPRTRRRCTVSRTRESRRPWDPTHGRRSNVKMKVYSLPRERANSSPQWSRQMYRHARCRPRRPCFIVDKPTV